MQRDADTLIWPKIAAAGLLYFALATSTILLTSDGKEIAPFWPANAVLAALMLQAPRRQWRTIVVVGFVANMAANMVARSAVVGPILYGIANMAELLVFAWGMGAPFARQNTLRDPSALIRILLWGGLVAPACSGMLGATTAWLAFGQPFQSSMGVWMMADSLGLLLFTPFFFSLFRGDISDCLRGRTGRQLAEALLLQGTVLATALLIFGSDTLPPIFLMPLPIMLVTFRMGWLGTKMAVTLVAIVVGVETVSGSGPLMAAQLGGVSPGIAAQIYLVSLLLIQMPIAAALTSRNELIERFVKSEKSVRLLAEQSQILLLRLDRTGRFVGVFGAAQALIGRSEAELLGHDFDALLPEVGEPLAQAFTEIMDDEGFDQVVEFAAPGKPGRWREARFRVLESDPTAGYEVGLTIHDITDRKRRERELVTRAHVDGMTGLLNRAGFVEKAQLRLGRAATGNIFMAVIDVDRFKLINDNLGHAAGDIVLQAVASRMKSQLRGDDIIGRLGGDEFAILLADLELEEARGACDRLVSSIAQAPVNLPQGAFVTVRISCGVARWNGSDDLDALQHAADMALYEAKRGGRNKAVAA